MNTIPSQKDQIKYAAFLRGINVGGHTLVKMDDLRKEFESLGYQNVKTVLASGNVVFEAPRENTTIYSQKIAQKLGEKLDRDITVIVYSLEDLQELEAKGPFKDVNIIPGSRQFITFISENIENRSISDSSMHDDFQILKISDRIICSILHEKPGVGTLDLMSAIEKQYGKDVTTRSWNTITRILKVGK